MVSATMALCVWTSPSRRAVDTASSKPPEARDRIVFDDLEDVRHLESVVQVPLHHGRGEQDLIASITAHEHASRSRHDVVFFGVSAHERTEIVACQTDVLEHGLHLGKVRAQFFRYAKIAFDQFRHARHS